MIRNNFNDDSRLFESLSRLNECGGAISSRCGGSYYPEAMATMSGEDVSSSQGLSDSQKISKAVRKINEISRDLQGILDILLDD